jgi:response regulator NasT
MRLLIADDEPLIRMGLKAMLEELGHTVTAVTNGREALDHIRRRPPDLAILDIQMPYTDGLQAAASISRHTPLPIIILTAFGQEDLIQKATDLPIHGYLIKPVTPAALSAAIAVAIKRFAETQELHQQTTELQEQIQTRKIIDRAKARLIAQGQTEEQAYQTLHQQARQTRQTLRQVAEAILA